MGKFLFITPPFAGHINPTVSVAAFLRRSGHSTAWVGYQRVFKNLLPEGATVFPLEDKLSNEEISDLKKRAYTTIGHLEALRFLYNEILIPFGRAMTPGVLAAIDAYEPDVLVVDNQAFAGVVAAYITKLKWATFATTSATLINPYKFGDLTLWNPFKWMDDAFAAFAGEYGVTHENGIFSPSLVVVFSTLELVGSKETFPSHYHFVGPAINDRPSEVPFPWEALAKGIPKILITLGTLNAEAGERFFGEVFDALAEEQLQAVLVASKEVTVNLKNRIPSNFIVCQYIPQLTLLPHMNAVLCHAGHNTVVESLVNGLPLVVAPIRDDQFIIASQVEVAGAGIKLHFRRAKAQKIRAAVRTVLTESSFREAAERIKASFINAGGSGKAATLLEKLL